MKIQKLNVVRDNIKEKDFRDWETKGYKVVEELEEPLFIFEESEKKSTKKSTK